MSIPRPTYTLVQITSGSFDVRRNGCLVASLVQVVEGWGVGWRIELLEQVSSHERPAPFTAQSHTFPSRSAALEWLGILAEDGGAEMRGRERKGS